MNQSLAFKSQRALLAWVVALLQVIGSLHFSLVRHGYSAALGGVVHLHSAPAARLLAPPSARPAQAPSASDELPSGDADLCSAADAPHSTAPSFQSLDAGAVAFGAARLLTEHLVPFATVRRALLAAPKTSPPV